MVCIENPKDYTKKLVYTNNELSETEIKKTIPFTPKWIKHIEINFTKNVKDLYMKTIKHWWLKLKKEQINGKVVHANGLEELILL